jgi:polysaccharide export outer membrane protein
MNQLTFRRDNAAARSRLAWVATWVTRPLIVLLCLAGLTGCQTQTPQFASFAPKPGAKPEAIVLREGDSVRITFPGAPTLNTVAQIRRDGRITLPMVGEFSAVGLTPAAMETELIKLYGPQLQSKEVTVSVESSAFPVYVSGAVLRPGKILSDRPITALEAIMEAGGFDTAKANMKAVKVIRQENGRTENHKLNLKRVLDGSEPDQFKIKPADIIFVPERFSWF